MEINTDVKYAKKCLKVQNLCISTYLTSITQYWTTNSIRSNLSKLEERTISTILISWYICLLRGMKMGIERGDMIGLRRDTGKREMTEEETGTIETLMIQIIRMLMIGN